jgi:hypothetical protein
MNIRLELSGHQAPARLTGRPVPLLRALLVTFTSAALAAGAGCSSKVAPSPDLAGGVVATFESTGERFKVFVKNAAAIERLIAIRNGAPLGQIPNARILRGAGAGAHNAPRAWHLDPDDIQIVDAAIELCDGRPSYVDAHVADYVDVIGRYCPWGARLVKLDDYR